jgi:glycine oxidase
VTERVVVVGAGIIGLAVAWRAAATGRRVTLVDAAPASGASAVAAGMLAPVTEVHHGEEPLLQLTVAGARRWPGFAAELERATGQDLGYRRDGTLLVAFDADDKRVLDDLHRLYEQLGLAVTPLRSREVRAREPLLAPRVRGGLYAADDHQVDPRRVTTALLAACADAQVTLVRQRAARVEHDGERVVGIGLDDGGSLGADTVVLAAGTGLGRLAGLPDGLLPPVRPVKGQILRLRTGPGEQLQRTVRGSVRGRPVYLVPRDDGEVVVGATQEELGDDRRVTAGGVRQLLDDAAAIVPGVDEWELVETATGLRPGSPDDRPVIGATSLAGLLLAAGHHRNGVLLAPVTADAIVALLDGTAPPAGTEVASPGRGTLRAHRSTADPGPTRDVESRT